MSVRFGTVKSASRRLRLHSAFRCSGSVTDVDRAARAQQVDSRRRHGPEKPPDLSTHSRVSARFQSLADFVAPCSPRPNSMARSYERTQLMVGCIPAVSELRSGDIRCGAKPRRPGALMWQPTLYGTYFPFDWSIKATPSRFHLMQPTANVQHMSSSPNTL